MDFDSGGGAGRVCGGGSCGDGCCASGGERRSVNLDWFERVGEGLEAAGYEDQVQFRDKIVEPDGRESLADKTQACNASRSAFEVGEDHVSDLDREALHCRSRALTKEKSGKKLTGQYTVVPAAGNGDWQMVEAESTD